MSLSGPEQTLHDSIGRREADLLDQLREHVGIPTGQGHTAGLDEYRGRVAERLETLGAEVTRVVGDPRPDWIDPPGAPKMAEPPPVLVARRTVAEAPRVLIVGHLDTVHDPAGDFRKLSEPARGIVTGPGAVDMKGGIVIVLSALEALAEAGVETSWTVVLNSDEETGSFMSDHVLKAEARRHDLGIVVEPALPGGALALARGGSGTFMIETRGRSAHTGRDFASGVSAVVELARVIGALHELVRPDDGVVVNVGPLLGGEVTNAVADYAACWGNVRYRDAAQADALGTAIDALATDPTALPSVTVHRIWNRPAKPETEAVRRFAETVRVAAADLGVELPFTRTGGVCDGNILQAEGLTTLDTLGVCGGNLHRTDEFVEVDSLVSRTRLMAVLLSRIAKGVPVGA